MAGVWLQICGLPPQTTNEEVSKLTRNRAIVVEIRDLNTVESAGRFLVDTMETAKDVLQRTNYVMLRGSLVKIGLSASDLKRCHLVRVRNFNSRAATAKRLHTYSKNHGTVCSVSVDEGQARVWFFEESEARSFVAGLGESSLCVGDPVAQLEIQDPPDASSQSVGAIVLDDDSDEDMDGGALSALRLPGARSLQTERDVGRALPVSSGSRAETRLAESAVVPHRSVARKSLGTKSSKFSRRVSSSPIESNHSGDARSVPKAVAAPDTTSSATASTSRRVTRGGAQSSAGPAKRSTQPAIKLANGNAQKAALPTNGSALATPQLAPRPSLDMDHWQSKAPYIYEYIYCQTANTFTDQLDGSMEHILSVAWSKSAEPGGMTLYTSLGNSEASSTIHNWRTDHDKPREDRSFRDSKSIITRSQFTLPARGSNTNGASTLAAFNGLPAGVTHESFVQDDFGHVVTGLKMHVSGNYLFGNGMRGLLVFDVNSLKRKGTLVVLNGVDGVYDVGRDYVVANSHAGEIGVWKSCLGKQLWRYNDVRVFKGAALAKKRSLITTLRIANDDSGVYAGDSGRGLSFCDFRERYIEKRSSPHTGVISSIEDAGEGKLLVGTYEGDLKLLDTRFLSEGKTSAICSYATGIAGAGIGNIRMCPQNGNMFACSVGSDVLIYYKETPANKKALVFSHQAHRTLVTDFSWHPSRNNMYTIGSVDIGGEGCPGELQVWRPTDMVMY